MSFDDDPFPDLSHVPAYDSFFNHPEEYQRYHIHLIGAENIQSDGRGAAAAIDKRRNRLGRPRVVDTVADPYVIVETVGDNEGNDTGSTSYFPIGKHTFPVLENSSSPLWDAKAMIMGKKRNVKGLRFQLLDKNPKTDDEMLMEFTLAESEFPAPTPLRDSTWTEYRKAGSSGRVANMVLVFRIMVTNASDQMVNKETSRAFQQTSTSGYVYTEEVLPDETTGDDTDNALLQCWRLPDITDTPKKAVLWILGRNDVFMHPHVASRLFKGHDLYVLNYKQNGHTRKRGWVNDAHFNSHNKYGNFNVYNRDIASALELIYGTDYDQVLGYAHSTGAPILLNYLMESGDEDFDGFLFNSPFLDWGFVGGDMVEFALEKIGMLSNIGVMGNDTKIDVAVTPDAFADTPVVYLNQAIVLSDWSAKFWSLYHWDWSIRPLYKVPMTVGFAKGVTDVHRKLEERHASKQAVTSKPFLVITSRGDDVLVASETLSRADWIGPSRWEIELNDNGHDVFLSHDAADTEMAIDMALVWLKRMKFA
jgi:alpha-beta hydrolase superfamily lysophospholipase